VKRLGVNIDHVATIRNARGEFHPNPFNAALFAKKYGANSITIHLREDRRHIKDQDAKRICSVKNLLVNLEISTNKNMINNALKIKPNYICIVPENRKEITTEGGLNLNKNKRLLSDILLKFKKKRIRTSLFINPTIKNIKLSKALGADCVEIHTGTLANLVKTKKNFSKEFLKIKNASKFAIQIGLEVHVGHGLDYKTTKILSRIAEIKEFNIGHFIIGESVFYGLRKVIKKFKKIINNN
jgi:pyridoxine 5-phosphate synthase